MINSKWFKAIFIALGLVVLLIGKAPQYWYIKFAFLPLIYIVILSSRNNYAWYFCFEFAIVAVFLSGALLIDQFPEAALWCGMAGIGIGILYFMFVIVMDTRGYPVRKRMAEKE
jgi:hypothetical protein